MKDKISPLAARPTGRAEKAATRREAIVNAALDEFTDKGFEAARMDDIARRAGVAKGTIYLNFKDKEALFEALVQQEIGPVVASAASPIRNGESVRAFIDRTILPLLHDLARSRRGLVLRLLVSESARFPKLADVYYRSIVERGFPLLRNLARRAVRTGELQQDALARFPQLFIAPAVVGIVWTLLFERFQTLDVEEMARAYFDQIFTGQPVHKRKQKGSTKM